MSDPIVNPTREQMLSLTGIIYAFRCKLDGKMYVGQTRRTFAQRHAIKWWKSTRRKSRYLAEAATNHGHEQFEVLILEHSITDGRTRNKREVFYARLYNTYVPNGYNLGYCGYARDIEISDETRRKISESRAREYAVKQLASGEIFRGRNLAVFCRERGLCIASMQKLATAGRGKSYRGFVAVNTTQDDVDNWRFFLKTGVRAPFTLWRDGVSFEVRNVKTFMREQKLRERNLSALVQRRKANYCGFTLANEPIPRFNRRYTDITLQHDTGRIETFSSCTDFHKRTGRHRDIVGHLALGISKRLCGWKLLSVTRLDLIDRAA